MNICCITSVENQYSIAQVGLNKINLLFYGNGGRNWRSYRIKKNCEMICNIMKKQFIIVCISALVVFAVGFTLTANNKPKEVACTMEAKLCPDGSSVGRTGLNCEFEPCPELTKEPGTTKINQPTELGGVSFTPLEVVEDSRCPVDVVCIQAGTVRARMRLEHEGEAQDATLTLGRPIIFAGKQVSLTSVFPAPQSQKTMAQSEYRFEFIVMPSPASGRGTIHGNVNIGPICPVERVDVPCPVPSEAYTSRDIVIYRGDGVTEITSFAINSDGTYSVSLAPGSYVLNMIRQGIDRGSGLPHAFTIIAGSSQEFDFSIDTGIR